ncbi:MAG: bifunctional DNA primase/polymerase [Dermatophilaceae bacterium]
MTGNTATLVDVRAMATWLAGHGIPVFPLTIGGKRPAATNGFHDATTNTDAIAAWWERTPYNLGMPTGGPARLLVVDLDTPKHDPVTGELVPLPEPYTYAADGADVLAALAAAAGQPMPVDTRTVATPRGGLHLYFTAPHPLPSTQSRLGPLVDTRGEGGYVVVPPSRTPDGAYITVNTAPVRPLPGWLVDALTPPPPIIRPPGTYRPPAPREAITDRYVLAAFENEVHAVLTAAPGTRNATVNRAAFALGQLIAAGRLNEDQVTAALTAAGEHTGLPAAEVARTITSGLRAAANHPRPDHQPYLVGRDTGRRA